MCEPECGSCKVVSTTCIPVIAETEAPAGRLVLGCGGTSAQLPTIPAKLTLRTRTASALPARLI